MEKHFETSCTDNILYPNKVMTLDWKYATYNSLEQAQNHITTMRKELGDKKYLLLSDFSRVKSMSRTVRQYLTSEDVIDFCAAHAIYTNSAIARMIGNLFMKFYRPDYPNRMFSDKKKAEKWLLEHTVSAAN